MAAISTHKSLMSNSDRALTHSHLPELKIASPDHDYQVSDDPQTPPRPVFEVSLWRYLNSCVMLGFGITLAYEGDGGSNQRQMALVVIWAFVYVFPQRLIRLVRLTTRRVYWANIIERECPHVMP